MRHPVSPAIDESDPFQAFAFEKSVGEHHLLKGNPGEGAVFKGNVFQGTVKDNIRQQGIRKTGVVPYRLIEEAFFKATRLNHGSREIRVCEIASADIAFRDLRIRQAAVFKYISRKMGTLNTATAEIGVRKVAPVNIVAFQQELRLVGTNKQAALQVGGTELVVEVSQAREIRIGPVAA